MLVQDLFDKILKVLEKDGHWIPSSSVAEFLGESDILKVDLALRRLAKQGFVKSNLNHTLNVKVYHSLEKTEKFTRKKCPLCGSVLKNMKCPNPTCEVDMVLITYKGE